MAALVGRHLDAARQDNVVAYATALHLARELVRADGDSAFCKEQCHWDHAEAWDAYRERLQEWRFQLVRGWPPQDLSVCPHCGRVQQLIGGRVRCFACGGQWVTDYE